MKKWLFTLFLTALCFTADAFAKNGSFEIIRPGKGGVFDENYASVVVKLSSAAVNKIIITDAEGKSEPIVVKPQKNVYCKSTKLKLGENRITVSSYKDAQKIDEESFAVFYRSEVFSGFQEEPNGYKKSFFHNDKDEQFCKGCHKLVDMTAAQKIPENPEDSSCHQCHKQLVVRAKGHAPTINWMCTQCHSGKTGEYNAELAGKSKFVAPDPIKDNCFQCHENIEKIWFSKKSEHGPVRDGRCNRCHNPHSSDHEFFMRKPIWDLCTTCHAEKATGAHVISSFVRNNTHPTKGKPDPARPGRELVCSGCHDPHGSEGIFLLRSKGKTAFSVCVRCHQK